MILIILCIIICLSHLLLLFAFPNPKGMKTICYDTCLVLGSPARPDGKLSRMQKSRMNKAIQLYKNHKTKTIIVSGGGVRNDFVEADIMGTYALQQGVEKDALIYERKAQNTYENLFYAKELCEKYQYQTILVVSSRFHVRRASFFVRKHFTNYAMVKTDDREKLKHYLAEYVQMWNTLRIEYLLKK